MASMIKMGEKRPRREMAPAQKRPAKPGAKKPVPMPKPKPRKPSLQKPVPMPKPNPRKPSGSMVAKKGAMPVPDAKAKGFVKRAKAFANAKKAQETKRELNSMNRMPMKPSRIKKAMPKGK